MHEVGLPGGFWFVLSAFLGPIVFRGPDAPVHRLCPPVALLYIKLTISLVVLGTKKMLMTTSDRIHLPLPALRPPIPTFQISACRV
jgi:hypothetical protein